MRPGNLSGFFSPPWKWTVTKTPFFIFHYCYLLGLLRNTKTTFLTWGPIEITYKALCFPIIRLLLILSAELVISIIHCYFDSKFHSRLYSIISQTIFYLTSIWFIYLHLFQVRIISISITKNVGNQDKGISAKSMDDKIRHHQNARKISLLVGKIVGFSSQNEFYFTLFED